MAFNLRTSCRLAIAVCILLCVPRSIAFKLYGSRDKDISIAKSERQDKIDLASLVRPVPDDQSEIYSHALQLLSALQGSPSCNRVAASSLLDSCHSIDGSKQDAELSFEDARSIYAAQLAVCEIESAESSIPQSCRALVPVLDSKVYTRAPQERTRKGLLSQCLQTLESRPQWWTSYSNNRQNAVVMCQAARVDIEKDELIKLHKSIIDTNAEANFALARATSQTNAALLQLHDEFALAKKTFQEQLTQDLDISTAKAQSFLERLVNSMEVAVHTAMGRLASMTKEMETDTARLSENVRKANVESIDLQTNVGKIVQQAVEGSTELAAFHTQHADRFREMAIGLQGSLQNMRDQEVNDMLSVFNDIQSQLQSSNDLVSSLHTRQDALDQRFISLDNSFAGFESKAESFHAVQIRQAEMQARLYNDMQNNMQVAQALLDNITSSATTAQTTIQSELRGAPRQYPTVICVSFLVFVLWNTYPKFVLCATALIVYIIIVKDYGAFDFPLSITSSENPIAIFLQSNRLLLPLLVFAVVLAIAAICHFTKIINFRRPFQLNITSNKPKLDMEKCIHAYCEAYGV